MTGAELHCAQRILFHLAADNFEDMENLGRCDYLPEVMQPFECELESSRLRKLGAKIIKMDEREIWYLNLNLPRIVVIDGDDTLLHIGM